MEQDEETANPKGGRTYKNRIPTLTPKQKIFCREFLVDRNATKAYGRAGYSAGCGAQSAAYVLICKPHVKAEINRLLKIQNDAVMVDATYVLQRLHDIDNLDILDIMDEEMIEFKPLSSWPREWRISINAMDISRIVNTRGKDGPTIQGVIEKIKWPDKTRNLELLGKHTRVMAFIPEENTGDAVPISKILVEVVGANNSD